jgi:predicted HTH transcriptional regulator
MSRSPSGGLSREVLWDGECQRGIVIIGVEDATRKVVGVPDERIGETMDIIVLAARQVIKPELVLDPPEPEVYVLAGKKLLVVTIPPTPFEKPLGPAALPIATSWQGRFRRS